jgi:tetratricopeptide (TPR) repeat protein
MDRSLESLAKFYRLRAWAQEGEETFARAARRLAEMQEQITDCESRMVLGRSLLQLGQFCDLLGLAEKGNNVLRQSLAIFRDLGARREMAYALYYLGWTVRAPGERRPLFEEGLAICEEINDRRGIALCLGGLGWVAWHQGKHKEVGELFQECLTLSRETGNQIGIPDSLYRLALDAAGLEEYGEAKGMLQECLRIFQEIGYLRGVENVLGDSGEMADVLGEYAEAIQFAQESLELSQQHDDRPGMLRSFRVLGEAACGLGDLPGARKHFRHALEAVATIRTLYYLLLALVKIAALLAAEGKRERALELLALVLHHPANWQYTTERAESLVAELEAELPPDMAAAAWERGRARDLDATVAELMDELAEMGNDRVRAGPL